MLRTFPATGLAAIASLEGSDPVNPEIIPADKRQRRLAMLAAVVVSVAGVAMIFVLRGYLGELEGLAKEHPHEAARKALRLTGIVAVVGGLSFVGAGWWLWRLGRRINLSGRFPPPGAKVVRDTRVRTGGQARAVANLAQLAAFGCIVAGTIGTWYLYRLAVEVLGR